jgi:DNA-3-methyladenine glycosylase
VPWRRRLTRLPRGFYARAAPRVAHDLVGKVLGRADDGILARIVEVEAYTQDDPACHAYRGLTERTAPLYGPPGHVYCYLNYGMHWLLNVSTGVDGVGEGCLIRAAEPLAGHDAMRMRRGAVSDRDLLRGPGRLGEAFGLDGTWSGLDLCGEAADPRRPTGSLQGRAVAAAANGGCVLFIADDGERPPVDVTPRTGVAVAADLERRFVVRGSPWASPYKRHPRAGRPTGPRGSP